MGALNRFEWEDDDGSLLTGTPVNNSELQRIFDAIDDEVQSVNKPAVSVRSIIDNLIAGVPFRFAGDANAWTDLISYATGAGYEPGTILAPGSNVWKVDSALLGGTLMLEGILKTNDITKAASLALVNLTDAPNVPIVEISTTSLTGALLRSAAIVWPAAGVEKEYGVKLKSAAAGGLAVGWSYRVFRSA